MLVLGIETSCDDTAMALVKDGKEVVTNVIASQTTLHNQYGGVYPEQACREHIKALKPVLHQSLGKYSLEDVDLIAVTKGPGLIGALLIGLNFAKGLAHGAKIPLVGINHIEAHLMAAMMHKTPQFPALGVVISGGHTSLVLIHSIGNYELIGQTQDDAIGETFDKAARMLDLPYPGGPEIEKLAKQGDANRFNFKAGVVKGRPFDFSFSGLKTQVLYLVKGQNAHAKAPLIIDETTKSDVAASFQRCAFNDLISKIEKASQKFGTQSIVIGGGVSNNRYLRALLPQALWPEPGLSLDNGAMIAALGYHVYQNEGAHSLDLMAKARIPFAPFASGVPTRTKQLSTSQSL